MPSDVLVRPGRAEDIPEIARVHVASWRETYRGVMADRILDDPGSIGSREGLWTMLLTDERVAGNRVAVAERDGSVIGVALSGPPRDEDALWSTQLFVLYVLAAHHGSGAGAALLDAVVDERHGSRKVEDGVLEMRMVRSARTVT